MEGSVKRGRVGRDWGRRPHVESWKERSWRRVVTVAPMVWAVSWDFLMSQISQWEWGCFDNVKAVVSVGGVGRGRVAACSKV